MCPLEREHGGAPQSPFGKASALGPGPEVATVTALTVLSTAALLPYGQETLEVSVSLFLSNFWNFLGEGDLGKCGWLFLRAISEPWEVK